MDGPDDVYEEYDKEETIEALAGVIRGLGHEVELLGDGRELVSRVLARAPDFVFNLAEGEGVGRCREARVPALLEMLGIPYSGSDALTMAATLDKSVAKRLARDVVEVPAEALISRGDDLDEVGRRLSGLFAVLPRGGVVLAKPAYEGSSKGIRGCCVAETVDEAFALVVRLRGEYREDVLVEEFIEGEEVTVGLIGNGDRLRVLGALRVVPLEATERFVYSLEVKRDWERRVRYEFSAEILERSEGLLDRVARGVYERLGCRDLARLDFRVRGGVPFFLEANPLPGLSPGTSDLVILARGQGIGYEELVGRILEASMRRCGLG